MDKPASIINLSASLRSAGFEPPQAAAALSLMLLWSQLPPSELNGLPDFGDTSAESVLRASVRVEKILCPEIADEIGDIWSGRRPSDVGALRRAVMNALDASAPVDEIAEAVLEYSAPDSLISRKHSNALLAVLDADRDTRIRCAFHSCLRPAWMLAKRSVVELDIENPHHAAILSILSKACGRNLKARVGTIGSVAGTLGDQSVFDHALIIAPIGVHQKFGPQSTLRFEGVNGRELSADSFATLWGARLGRERNVVVVGNGALFRRSRTDAAFKRGLIERQGLQAIVSLPPGLFSGSAMGTSALVFSGADGARPRRKDTLRLISGSDPAALGPVSLSKLLSDKLAHPLCVDAPMREVAENGFNLLVDRYVWDPASQIQREMLSNRETARLSDLADIHRPETLPRGSRRGKGLEVREALLADIRDGRLTLPAKPSELAEAAATKVAAASIKPGDILLSVKGAIGKVALVTADVIAESEPVPIVAGQSLVIIRLREGGAIHEPEVLFSYLRSPVAQSLLRVMAGGAAIANIAMRDLKTMPAPVLPAEIQKKVLAKYHECQSIQRDIDKLIEKMKDTEAQIFKITLLSS